MSAITAAGRRRQAGLQQIKTRVDELLDQSEAAQREARDVLAAIMRRAEQNHIAEGVALAFAERRRRDPN
jgi:hypothetical protein